MIGEEKIKDKTEDIDKAEDEREIDKIERDKAGTPEKRDEKRKKYGRKRTKSERK